MSESELRNIIDKGETLLNVDFSEVKSDIVDYSSGLAAV